MKSPKTYKGFFITGTDTGIGKTTVATLLAAKLKAAGYSAQACKPVASGGIKQANHFIHEDVLNFQKVNTKLLNDNEINPIRFDMPISPNIAAEKQNYPLTAENIFNTMQPIFNHYHSDYLIVEGIGGWMVPLNAFETTADLAELLDLSVILVVGIKLGCLNHALLTANALQNSNVKKVGWIANRIDANMIAAEENIATLKQWLKIKYLGSIPYLGDDDHSLKQDLLTLDINELLKPASFKN